MNPFAPILSVFSRLGIPAPIDLVKFEMGFRWGELALMVAREEVGKGEGPEGNNQGPDITRYRLGDGTGGKGGGKGAWCATFLSYCFAEASRRHSIALPFRTSRGAKRLFKNACKAGGRVVEPEVGDIACWDRGVRGDWRGHVELVARVNGSTFHSYGGNRGRWPSSVELFRHAIGEDRLIGFARI